jgi:hypothetical protein
MTNGQYKIKKKIRDCKFYSIGVEVTVRSQRSCSIFVFAWDLTFIPPVTLNLTEVIA